MSNCVRGDMIPAGLTDSRDSFVQQSGLTVKAMLWKPCLKADGQNLESLLESESPPFHGNYVISIVQHLGFSCW